MTETDICNLALGMLGHDRTITTDFRTATSTEAMRCRLFFDACRKKILAAAAWLFAEDSVTLNNAERIGNGDFEWYYQVPADCLNIVRMNCPDFRHTPGGIVCAARLGVELVYTRDVSDLTLWPQPALDALAAELAARLVVPMTGGNEEKTSVMRAVAKNALDDAKLWNANQTPQRPPNNDRYAKARN